MTTVMVVGTGRLATAFCLATAGWPEPIRVVVVGRSAPAVEELCLLTQLRARLLGSPVELVPAISSLERTTDLVALVNEHGVEVVLCCASRQSPWEEEQAPSAWTALLARAGIAMSLALHCHVACLVGEAAAQALRPVTLLNACYPDAVNPVLAAASIPVLAGVGNAQVTHHALSAGLAVDDDRRLAVAAHHLHLGRPAADSEARAWLDDTAVGSVRELLESQRRASRHEVSAFTGAAAARTVLTLLSGDEFPTSLPGCWGWPGGYPVTVGRGGLELRLPAGVTRTDAIRWNEEWSRAEGAVVASMDGRQRVIFSPAVADVLAPHLGSAAFGFDVVDLPQVITAFMELRSRLRREPVHEGC